MATYYIIGKICSTANGYTLGTISRYDYHVEIAHCISEANVEYPFFIKHTTEDHLPNISDADKGFQYYDTDINKPIWWNGFSWTDASGTTV